MKIQGHLLKNSYIQLKRRIFPILLFVVCSAITLPHTSSAIFNGEPAEGSPFVVSIRVGTGSCSGTMVRPQILATAGHCVVKNGVQVDPQSIRVWAPGVNRNSTSHVAVGVALFVPEDYLGSENNTIRPKDIAFVVLDRKISGTVDLVLANYDFAQSLIEIGSEIRLFGYGRISQSQTTSTPYSIIGYPIEQARTRSFIGFERFYLNYDASEEGSTCPGDSGGPAISRFGEAFVLVSIHSGSRGPCSSDSDGPWRITATIAGEFQYLLDEALSYLQVNKPGQSQNLVLDIYNGEATLSWDPPSGNIFHIEGYTVIDGESGIEFCKTVQTVCNVKVVPGPNVFVVFAETAANSSPGAVFSFDFKVPPIDSVLISEKGGIGTLSWSISEELEEIISGYLVTNVEGNPICQVIVRSCSTKLEKGLNSFVIYSLYGEYRSSGLETSIEFKESKKPKVLTCSNGKTTKTLKSKNLKCPSGFRKV
jgi:V8-like Glu-specific endopeptidase